MRMTILSFGALALAALPRVAAAAPTVWAIDDGQKIKRDATQSPFENGTDNPVWSPGQPIKLFALRGETVAFQVIVEADAAGLSGVTVDLDALTGPGGATIANAPGPYDPTSFVGRHIDRFVEHYFQIKRASGGTDPSESLGWRSGSGPTDGPWTGWVPDALIPVEVAPAWSPYPMTIAPSNNGAVWVDVTIPEKQPAGTYQGQVVVKAGGAPLATLPISLEVVRATLPDRPVDTMLYYEPSSLHNRIGAGDAAEDHLFRLFRRHHLTTLHDAMSTSDITRQLAALDGSEYTPAHGYEGPGEGKGDGLIVLGTYGGLGSPTASSIAKVEAMADMLAQKNLLQSTKVVLYAIDESCGSSLGKAWKDALAADTDPNVAAVKVGWTCSSDPSKQPVDIPMILASRFDPAKAQAARQGGKDDVWVYNGVRPFSGTFLTDSGAIEPRVNGWLGGMYDVGRWFYWETSFWYDGHADGNGPYDPFVTAETFHNGGGDYCEGDGVLVYPGKQVDMFTQHSVGVNGVLPSIRLKNWRRGIEDAGYYKLAHAANGAAAEQIAHNLLPSVFNQATSGEPASWSTLGKPFFDARKALVPLIPLDPPEPPPGGGSGGAGGAGGGGATSGGGTGGAGSTTTGGAGGSGSTTGGTTSGGGSTPGTTTGATGAGGSDQARGGTPGDATDEGSCAVRAGGSTSSETRGALALTLLGLGLVLRRRRG